MSQNILTNTTTPPLAGSTAIGVLNGAVDSLAKWFSGTAAPTASAAGLANTQGFVWHDIATNTLKVRDQADSTWIIVGYFDETNKNFTPNINAATFYAADTGAANAYVVAPAPAWSAYNLGALIYFVAAYSNTGASTINVSSLGTKPLVRRDGTASQAGDILTGTAYVGLYDGTSVRLLSVTPASTLTAGSVVLAQPSDVIAGSSATKAVTPAAFAGQMFESATFAISALANSNSVAHGLGVKPKRAQLFVRCLTAEQNYAAGDEIPISTYSYNGASFVGGYAYIINATNVGYVIGNSITIANAATGAGVTLTNANWALVVRAWAY